MKKKVVLFIIIIFAMFMISGCGKNNKINKNKGSYTSFQIIEFLEEEGFEFKMKRDSTLMGINRKYIYAYDDSSTIWIQKIVDPYTGTSYTWHNSDLNDEYAEIKNTYKNDGYKKEQQYKEYQKWLKYYGLTNKQIIDTLDYYDENN